MFAVLPTILHSW